MAEQQDEDDKTEEATAHKLAEARRKGDIIYTPEATAWLMLAVFTLLIAAASGPMAGAIGQGIIGLIAQPHAFATDADSLMTLARELMVKVGAATGLALAGLWIAGIAGRYLQDQPTLSGEKLKPKIEKLNPIEGFKRVFGKAAFASFLKGLAKLVLVGAAVGWALWPRDGTLEQVGLLDLSAFWPLVKERSLAVMYACLAAFGLIAALDYFFTRQSFMKRQRMSRTEVKEEYRQTEGDPQVRAKLRQIRMERGQRRMMQKVPEATLVVTNPTHYAVALKYDETTPAPICLAKGVDAVALKIREAAGDADVPVIEDPPLARALYASAELDKPIPRAHYEAVAKLIGVVMRLAQRRRPLARGTDSRGPNQPQ